VWPSPAARVRFLLGGFVADKRFAPSVAARENPENDFDFRAALALVEEDHLQMLLRECERIVASRWHEIEAVAQALLQRERVEAMEIYRIIVAVR
jgi:hypothetical protein